MRRRRRSAIWRLPGVSQAVLLFLALCQLSSSLKCYCTDDNCVPYGACDGAVCLVGILKESNQVIRTCGNRPIGCYRDDDDKWSDLCVCDSEFCNTFSYLRQNTQKAKAPAHYDHQPSEDSEQHYFKSDPKDFHDDEFNEPPEGHLVFHRMDRPDNGYTHNPDAPISTQTTFLTVLLVVVPLTVGAGTVIVVALNYYCHLC